MELEFQRIGFAPDYVDYQDGWDLQRRLHAEVSAGTRSGTVLLLEHHPVYTAGRRTEEHERPFDGTPVISVDRGGKLTWHGPGQLVGYPILRLPDPVLVVEYVAALEDALITVLMEYGLHGERVDGRSGVWIRGDGLRQDRKIAAVGIRVDRGVTMHGFALNCSNDLNPYGQIIACGISDAGTTSISAETGAPVSPGDVAEQVEVELIRSLGALSSKPGASPSTAAQAGAVRNEGALK